MFDIGFSELLIIAVVALVVIGPKRLPVVARVAGRMLGQFNRYVGQVKAEVKKEMERAELADIRREFENQVGDMRGNLKSIADLPTELSALENSFNLHSNEAHPSPATTTALPASDEVAAPAITESPNAQLSPTQSSPSSQSPQPSQTLSSPTP